LRKFYLAIVFKLYIFPVFIEKGFETKFGPISMLFENKISPLFVNAGNLDLNAEN